MAKIEIEGLSTDSMGRMVVTTATVDRATNPHPDLPERAFGKQVEWLTRETIATDGTIETILVRGFIKKS